MVANRIFRFAKELKHGNIFPRDARVLVLGEDNFEFTVWLGGVTKAYYNICATTPARNGSDEIKTTGINHHSQLITKGGGRVLYDIGLAHFSSNPNLFGESPNDNNLFDRVVCHKTDSAHLFSHCVHCSKKVLRPGGEVYHFDSRNGGYNSWDIKQIAEENQMDVEELWFKYLEGHDYTILRFFNKPKEAEINSNSISG